MDWVGRTEGALYSARALLPREEVPAGKN